MFPKINSKLKERHFETIDKIQTKSQVILNALLQRVSNHEKFVEIVVSIFKGSTLKKMTANKFENCFFFANFGNFWVVPISYITLTKYSFDIHS